MPVIPLLEDVGTLDHSSRLAWALWLSEASEGS